MAIFRRERSRIDFSDDLAVTQHHHAVDICFGNAISESNKAVTALEGTPSASGVERGNSLICA